MCGGHMETWRSVRAWKGLYQVSNRGRIRSLSRIILRRDGQLYSVQGKILKQTSTDAGYLCVTLCDNGKQIWYLVHILVAKAWLPNLLSKSDVNHKDGNKQNNRKSNLEWATKQENEAHARITGLKASGMRCYTCKIPDEEIPNILQRIEAGERLLIISLDYGVSKCTICDIKAGRRKAARREQSTH